MVESPTKPRMEVSDREKIAAEAKKQGVSGLHQ
ncbi:MAG: hypothetical protein IID13_05185 [Candidatus Marinimicrobia bacterium]|nr:hypothetical protein [Candidatus Neomarinimicrobiota bacterium]